MKCNGKHFAKLIFTGSLLVTLAALALFPENFVQNNSFVKLKYYSQKNEQMAKLTQNIAAHTCNRTKSSNSPCKSQSFTKLMHSFPWNSYQNATIQKNLTEIKKYTELLITSILIPFVTKEPPIPVNTSCEAPPSPSKPENITCFPRNRTTVPKKIGVILNFGFDVDALEVHLHELDSIVDKFFLVEGLKINNRFLDKKPSIWDMVKFSPRFSQFERKIVHFIVDDGDYHEGTLSPGLWDREGLQGKLRLKKFLEWNNATGYFAPDDWIGIGDTDEIPSRETINLLKKCNIEGDADGGVDIGIWFPFPFEDTIFKSDFPVKIHPYNLGNPTYWKVSALEKMYKNGSSTGRRAGQGKKFLKGGMHFSLFPYLPFQLTKLVTGSESEVFGIEAAIGIGMNYLNSTELEDQDIEEAALKKWEKLVTTGKQKRILSLEKFRRTYGNRTTNDFVKIPWFYQCNPERYLGFKRKLDNRLL